MQLSATRKTSVGVDHHMDVLHYVYANHSIQGVEFTLRVIFLKDGRDYDSDWPKQKTHNPPQSSP